MPFQLDIMLAVVILVVALMTVLLIAWRIRVGRELAEGPDREPGSLEQLDQARIEPGEKPAMPIPEQIEGMVRAELAEKSLQQVDIDFGTNPDGSLAIWFEGRKYDGPAGLPDARVRQAVLDAVDKFNQQKDVGAT